MPLMVEKKPLFGVEKRAPAKVTLPIATAEAADSVLDTIASLVVDKKAIKSQLDKIEKVKSLPPLVKPYPYCLKLYLQIEKLISESKPPITKERYDEKSLREVIKKKIEVFKLKKPLLYIFLDEDELNLSFLYDLINAFTLEVSSSLKKDSLRKLDKIYRAIPLFGGVRFSSAGLFPFEPIAARLKKAKVGKGIRVSYAISPIFTAASRFLASIYFEAVACLGEKQAKELLKKTYESTEKSYGFLPSLPDIYKYLPPGVFEAVGAKVAAAAAAAAAASTTEKMMQYVADIIVSPEQARPVLDRLEIYRKLPFREKEDAYLLSYLELEDYIASHKPPLVKKGYTLESLRGEIKNTFNVRRLRPKFSSLFRIRGTEKLIYYELFIESLIIQISQLLDVQRIVDTVTAGKLTGGIGVKGAKIDFSVPEQKIFNLPPQWHKLITTNFKDLFSELYIKTKEKLGETRAREILEETYRTLQEKYGTLPLFSESVSIFLEGILEEVVLLRRDELELRIKDRTKALEEAKAYVDNIIKNMIDTLLVVDPDGKIKTINPAIVKLLGYKEDELIGKPVAVIFAEEEEEEEEEEVTPFKGTRMKKLIEEGSIRDYEMTYKTKSGEKIPVSFSGSVMRGEDGNLVGIVGIAHDMREIRQLMQKEKELAAAAAAAAAETDRKRAAELEKAYRDLRETQAKLIQAGKMAAMGTLGAGIAHQLNQPLAGIRGFAQTVLMQIDKKNPFYEDLKKIEEQTGYMRDVILNISGFARQAEFKKEPIDINEPIEKSLQLFSEQIRLHGIKLVKNLDPNLPKVNADLNQMQQVFVNFITNSREAMDDLPKEAVKELEISSQKIVAAAKGAEKEFVEITFKDTGSGIPDEIKDRIFEPFFTTKGPRSTGLGLSLNYGMVQDHGGVIEFEGKAGKGTTFIVRLSGTT